MRRPTRAHLSDLHFYKLQPPTETMADQSDQTAFANQLSARPNARGAEVIPNAFKIHHLIDECRAFHRELPCWSDMQHLMNLMSSAGQIVFEAWSWHHSYLGRIHDTLHWTTHLNEMRLTQVGSVSSRIITAS